MPYPTAAPSAHQSAMPSWRRACTWLALHLRLALQRTWNQICDASIREQGNAALSSLRGTRGMPPPLGGRAKAASMQNRCMVSSLACARATCKRGKEMEKAALWLGGLVERCCARNLIPSSVGSRASFVFTLTQSRPSLRPSTHLPPSTRHPPAPTHNNLFPTSTCPARPTRARGERPAPRVPSQHNIQARSQTEAAWTSPSGRHAATCWIACTRPRARGELAAGGRFED
jgi:hypothetical protein